ncbi:Probable hexaprenyl pyrophosphate synthase, mitochondrial Short=HPS; Flags: Precursor [Serendipita indica DSM 11827]|uniref:(2E,6E)-farnesyl diphosphate synthase n=1 Tax=Serendipita indica (strain DSM 11827) TaxID=1109443 RepID=G4TC84_SERID|nr:Probable hexaprenyl pyrophosphate synthase, mitochondrial Short=HPS; Flags: Precursor [Serendipita indica DSM 11827]CCA68933.1 related to COQ1-hexaprenyl pyrophosphate synthetase precursor [Serendipita indica DSM 11827]
MRSFKALRRLDASVHTARRYSTAFAAQNVAQRHAQPSLEPSSTTQRPTERQALKYGNSSHQDISLTSPREAGTQNLSTSPKISVASATNSADPFALVSSELEHLRKSMLTLMGSAHPGLTQIAEYYFLQPSKQLRPLLVLLFARATNGLGQGWENKRWLADVESAKGLKGGLDAPLTRSDVLNDWNPNIPEHTASFSTVFNMLPAPSLSTPLDFHPPPIPKGTLGESRVVGDILPTQIRLAQIAEMIHVASLLHDDVIDTSPLRRGVPSGPASFGNKLTVLGGDFLLGRASAALSRLGENEVVELVASIIANLVEGEVMQVREVHAPETLATHHDAAAATAVAASAMAEGIVGTSGRVSQERWNIYLKKTYLKTASLIAKTVRGSVVLGGAKEGEVWKEVAYAYGRNIGIAFQLIDDMLDFAVSDASFGKPSGGADLRLGLATAPTLYAWEEFEEMGPLIQRRFEGEGDVELARQIVASSKGVARTRELAESYAVKAREVLDHLPDSDAKQALSAMTEIVIKRKH